MRCWLCPRDITTADAPKRVEWRNLLGDELLFGQDCLPLVAAHGTLVKAAHGKCYHAWRKRADGGAKEEHAHEDDRGGG